MEEPHRSWSFPLVGVLPIRHTEQVAAQPTYHHEWQQPQGPRNSGPGSGYLESYGVKLTCW